MIKVYCACLVKLILLGIFVIINFTYKNVGVITH